MLTDSLFTRQSTLTCLSGTQQYTRLTFSDPPSCLKPDFGCPGILQVTQTHMSPFIHVVFVHAQLLDS